MNASLGDNIDRAFEEFFEVLAKAEIEQGPIRIHVNKEVDITRRTRIAARNGAEHPDVARAVLSSDPQDGGSAVLNVHARSILSR